MAINVCIAGATGWVGKALAEAIRNSQEFVLTGAIARSAAGQDLGEALGSAPLRVTVASSLDQALAQPADVLIDYTTPASVRQRALEALARGVRVVIGTSGLSAADYAEIDAAARAAHLGVIAAGNFSLTAALAKHFALIAARHLPTWEIIDYAGAAKPDAPSGTVQELAEELGGMAANQIDVPIAQTHGEPRTRGASIGGAQVHSVRLPGYVLAFEALFGLPDERLTIRHDAGSGAAPYVGGTLLAVRKVMHTTGLIRGLDHLLFDSPGA